MKSLKKISSVLLAVMLMFTELATVSADDYDPSLSGSEIGSNGKIEVNKYLVITGNVAIPDASFDYEITYPESTDPNTKAYINATATNPVVYPGNVASETNRVKVSTTTNTTAVDDINTLSFSSADTAKDGPLTVQTNNNVFAGNSKGSADDVVIAADQKYVTKTVTLDFSALTFTEPGVYRFWLQEKPYSHNPASLSNDTQVETNTHSTWRTIDVYVVDDDSYVNGSTYTTGESITGLAIQGVVMYEGKLEDNDKPKSSIDWTFNIENNSVEPLDENNTLPQSTATNIVEVQWVDGEDTYDYDSTQKKWKKNATLSTTELVDTVPDGATATGVAGTFKENYDAKYNAQKKAYEEKMKENTTEAGEKNVAYVNQIELHNLTVKKTVTGNQGSKDKYFKFTIEFDNVGTGTVLTINRTKHDTGTVITSNLATPTTAQEYPVSEIAEANDRDDNKDSSDGYQVISGKVVAQNYLWEQEDKTYKYDETASQWVNVADATDVLDELTDNATCKALANLKYGNVSTLPEQEDKKATITVFLQHDEEVVIQNIPKGATYKVTEVDANLDGYVTTIDGDPIEKEVSNDETKVFDGKIGETVYQDNNGKYFLLSSKETTTQVPVEDMNTKYRYDETTSAYVEDAAGTYVKDIENKYQLASSAKDVSEYLNTNRYSKDVTVEYENDRKGILPTGVAAAASTGLIILGIGAAGMFVFGRKKEDDDEE